MDDDLSKRILRDIMERTGRGILDHGWARLLEPETIRVPPPRRHYGPVCPRTPDASNRPSIPKAPTPRS